MADRMAKASAMGSKPVPMRLFATWEVDKSSPSCIPRYIHKFYKLLHISVIVVQFQTFWKNSAGPNVQTPNFQFQILEWMDHGLSGCIRHTTDKFNKYENNIKIITSVKEKIFITVRNIFLHLN